MGLFEKLKNAIAGDSSPVNPTETPGTTPGNVPESSPEDLIGYLDPVDPLPGEDDARDRDHFPDEVPDEEIDNLLNSIAGDPHFVKFGRPEDPPENDEDPDDDPDYYPDAEEQRAIRNAAPDQNDPGN